MKLQFLPSTFDENGRASQRQHLSCLIVDDSIAIDAGSLAMAVSGKQREQIRDIVLTHAHLDHIAGLPLFIDDLFANLTEPIRIHTSADVMEVLERDVFNWSVYPRFSELFNERSAVVEYKLFENGAEFSARHLKIESISVNHKVPSVGFLVSDGEKSFAISGDTTRTDDFWKRINTVENLGAILIECAFPNELNNLADVSFHLTPSILQNELTKYTRKNCPVYVINIKPMYREQVVLQIESLNIENLKILEIGRVYEI